MPKVDGVMNEAEPSAANYIIFAAGMGSRLNAGLPKCLVPLDDRCLFEYQLSQLQGLTGNLVVVCGFMADQVCERFISKIGNFEIDLNLGFLLNPEFRQSQLTSIRCALEYTPRHLPTYLIDGDMLFERQSIVDLERSPHTAVLVRSDITNDAVIAEMQGDRLIRFARNGSGNREWANLAKYLPEDRECLQRCAAAPNIRHHFEVLNLMMSEGCSIDWRCGNVAEVDEPDDLKTAIEFARRLSDLESLE